MKTIHVFTNEIVLSIYLSTKGALMISVFDSLTKNCESVCVEIIKDIEAPKLIKYLPEYFVRTAIDQGGFYFNKQLIVIAPHKCYSPIELLGGDYKLIY